MSIENEQKRLWVSQTALLLNTFVFLFVPYYCHIIYLYYYGNDSNDTIFQNSKPQLNRMILTQFQIQFFFHHDTLNLHYRDLHTVILKQTLINLKVKRPA